MPTSMRFWTTAGWWTEMRKQVITVRCDGDGCKSYADVADLRETPAGWYHVAQANEAGKTNGGFDLCSTKCIERWAKGRRIALGETEKKTGDHRHRRVICPECTTEIGVQGFHHHFHSVHPGMELPNKADWVYAE